MVVVVVKKNCSCGCACVRACCHMDIPSYTKLRTRAKHVMVIHTMYQYHWIHPEPSILEPLGVHVSRGLSMLLWTMLIPRPCSEQIGIGVWGSLSATQSHLASRSKHSLQAIVSNSGYKSFHDHGECFNLFSFFFILFPNRPGPMFTWKRKKNWKKGHNFASSLLFRSSSSFSDLQLSFPALYVPTCIRDPTKK